MKDKLSFSPFPLPVRVAIGGVQSSRRSGWEIQLIQRTLLPVCRLLCNIPLQSYAI